MDDSMDFAEAIKRMVNGTKFVSLEQIIQNQLFETSDKKKFIYRVRQVKPRS